MAEGGSLMRVALFSSAKGDKWRLFVNSYGQALREHGVNVAVAVLDDQSEKRRRVRHAWDVAKRQARLAECSVLAMLCRIIIYKCALSAGNHGGQSIPEPTELAVVHVPTLNSVQAVQAVRAKRCDLVCLMGTRVISANTLSNLGVPVINIHSSDPSFVRGGPPVVWEILDRRESVVLTIHQVVEQVDTGAILRQAVHPITYAGGLGKTVCATTQHAKSKVADLFFEVILDHKQGCLAPTEFSPGQLRVTPSVCETLRADGICRRMSLSSGHGA